MEGIDIVKKMENVQTDLEDVPKVDVMIIGSKRRKVKKPYYVSDDPYK